MLVGCDGIHSVVRQHLRGNEEKHFANILMWRSLIPAERLEGLDLEERGNYWFGPGRTLITYWVRPKNLYSILASVPAHEVQRESWTDSGDISEMLRSFDDAEPRARTMLEQCRSVFITGMYYRDPIDSWTSAAASRCSATPRIRWCRSSPPAPARASRMPGRSRACWRGGRTTFPGALLEYRAAPAAAHHAHPGRRARRGQADA